jgi:imidazolonepropionase-like amidohydrolase
MAVLVLLLTIPASIAGATAEEFVRITHPRVLLTRVNLIDGTGTPAEPDQSILIEQGRIASVGPNPAASPPDTLTIDLQGRSVIPGLVGMHDHLFYGDGSGALTSLPRSFARLYLAAGVTTIRTAGAVDLPAEAGIKRAIDEGRDVGPRIYLSGPYLGATSDLAAVEHTVEQLANAGVTSLKAYTPMGSATLDTAIRAAHRRGLKVTGHLCAVGFREAAALGIDNLEHGIVTDTEFYSAKVPDRCPDWGTTVGELTLMTIQSAPIQETIRTLIDHRVAITSTLAVFETLSPRTAFFDRRVAPVLSRSAWAHYVDQTERRSANPSLYSVWHGALAFEMAFEKAFVQAGGHLMAGADPTGWGGVLPGFGDQRNVELLVEAGFTAEQAIQIASANGAAFLDNSDIGTIEPGKLADLVVVRGNPASRIQDIREVEMVFKGGIGYDPVALTRAEHGAVAMQKGLPWLNIAIGPAVVLVLIGWRFLTRRRSRATRGR